MPELANAANSETLEQTVPVVEQPIAVQPEVVGQVEAGLENQPTSETVEAIQLTPEVEPIIAAPEPLPVQPVEAQPAAPATIEPIDPGAQLRAEVKAAYQNPVQSVINKIAGMLAKVRRQNGGQG